MRGDFDWFFWLLLFFFQNKWWKILGPQGTVVTWGQDFDASPPKDLRVQRLLAANGAAIAALAKGKLVTWGQADAGGDTGSWLKRGDFFREPDVIIYT